jgi:eukaryotic-like serine/threonine-protein kinase
MCATNQREKGTLFGLVMAAPRPSFGIASFAGTVAGRFTIERCLGAGGMGEVYLARDTLLKRSVALKRLSSEWRSDENSRRRLLYEASRTSALSSPRIAAVFDVLEHDSELFIVMEYVPGTTLRARIGSPLSLRDFLDIATECAEALVTAHASSIIHRDLKPENIMLLPSGGLKVLDFGLSRRIGIDQHASTITVDEAGSNVQGTMGYIAPEVLRDRPPDERSDVFALGVIFYEMLTGKHPFRTETFFGTFDRTINIEPPTVSQLRPDVPQRVSALVEHMLAKATEARCASAAEVLRELQMVRDERDVPAHRRTSWITLLLLAVLFAFSIVGVRLALLYNRRVPTLPAHRLLAVLPFRAVAPSGELQVITEGLTETTTAKLAHISSGPELQIVPASEVRRRHIGDDPDQARKELGVDLAIVGSVERSGDRVRVNYALVDAAAARQLSAGTVVADASDPFAIEDNTVERLLSLLNVELQPANRRDLAQHGTNVQVAYEDYLRGVGYMRSRDDDPHNVDKAVTAFQHALSLDANYGLAYAGLGQSLWLKYGATHDAAFVAKARSACEQAVSLAPSAAQPHVCLGTLSNGIGKYENAVAEFNTALSADAQSDDAYVGLAKAYESLGKMPEAESTFQRAIAVRPQYWAGYVGLARFYSRLARYAEAATEYNTAAERAPQNSSIYTSIGGLYIYTGKYDKATEALKHAIALNPRYDAYSNLGYAYFRQRMFDDAIRAFEQAQSLGAHDFETWGNLADVYYWAPAKRKLARTRYLRAIELGEQRLHVNPKDNSVHVLLAHYYAAVGRRADAMRHLQSALADQDPEVLYYAALVFTQLGDYKQGIQWLQAAITHGYSRFEIASAIELDGLRDTLEFKKLMATN